MQVIATATQIRISPRKARLVADAVRDLPLVQALAALDVIEKRGSGVIKKTIMSAVANATNNAKMQKDNLKIFRLEISEGPALKRYHASTRGRIHPYKRRSSHIRVILEEVTK
ncbi:MAG: 50S ribosomal protein L22 [Candidatus Levybacteria bacterium]|nr:50S ribosomal protein L22 [Candidatus Levybacteria bacterium]